MPSSATRAGQPPAPASVPRVWLPASGCRPIGLGSPRAARRGALRSPRPGGGGADGGAILLEGPDNEDDEDDGEGEGEGEEEEEEGLILLLTLTLLAYRRTLGRGSAVTILRREEEEEEAGRGSCSTWFKRCRLESQQNLTRF